MYRLQLEMRLKVKGKEERIEEGVVSTKKVGFCLFLNENIIVLELQMQA